MFIKGGIKYKALSLEACGKVLEYYVCDCNILFPHKKGHISRHCSLLTFKLLTPSLCILFYLNPKFYELIFL